MYNIWCDVINIGVACVFVIIIGIVLGVIAMIGQNTINKENQKQRTMATLESLACKTDNMENIKLNKKINAALVKMETSDGKSFNIIVMDCTNHE